MQFNPSKKEIAHLDDLNNYQKGLDFIAKLNARNLTDIQRRNLLIMEIGTRQLCLESLHHLIGDEIQEHERIIGALVNELQPLQEKIAKTTEVLRSVSSEI